MIQQDGEIVAIIAGNTMISKTVHKISLRTEGDTEFVTLYFDDGSEIDLKGPRSGLKVEESEESGVIRYKCEFTGFTLA
jgi:hypothetical protein